MVWPCSSSRRQSPCEHAAPRYARGCGQQLRSCAPSCNALLLDVCFVHGWRHMCHRLSLQLFKRFAEQIFQWAYLGRGPRGLGGASLDDQGQARNEVEQQVVFSYGPAVDARSRFCSPRSCSGILTYKVAREPYVENKFICDFF